MRILVNTSNLKIGGGIQVADSILRELYKYDEHYFVVVYPDSLEKTILEMDLSENIITVKYNLPIKIVGTLTGRDIFLDKLVAVYKIDAVLTVFGPSRWIPKVTHLCGFAISHCLLKDSPYWKILPMKSRIRLKLKVAFLKEMFRRCSEAFYTENEFISRKLESEFKGVRVYTVTNTYNQCFDFPESYDVSIKLPDFKGYTVLSVASDYPHKNLRIIRSLIRYISECYPDFQCRFVLTISKERFTDLTELEESHIVFLGPVPVFKCPNLYKQADFMLMPTLLECFSASYAEAMKMGVPIITTDLPFAHSICRDAAVYYDAMDFKDLGDKLYALAGDSVRQKMLIASGMRRLSDFDNYVTRTGKLISILEKETEYSLHS